MKKVAVVGCGAYMESGYGCPGEWRCLKAAALGEGKFDEPSQVVAFVQCECPGRTAAPNLGITVNWFSFFHGLATAHALFVIRK
jgi:hypothetical protein